MNDNNNEKEIENAASEGLDQLTQDVRKVAALDSSDIPVLRSYEKEALISLVEKSALRLPPIYRETVGTPLVNFLTGGSRRAVFFWNHYINPSRLQKYSAERFFVEAVLDVIQAVVQQGGFGATTLANQTKAFQEVISDLYAGFLSREARQNVKPPDHQKIPPLVKWGNKEDGPYTIPADTLSSFIDLETAIVSLPPGFAKGGIVAFTTLGHESTGHDILNADEGLLDELKSKLQEGIKDPKMRRYWLNVMEEAVSDILGLLHFGPSAALGLIAFFRGWSEDNLLRCEAPKGDVHPIDILRGYLAVEVLRLTSNTKWNDFILAEVDKDLNTGGGGNITLPSGERVSYSHTNPTGKAKTIKDSIVQFAQVVLFAKLKALEDHSFTDIQVWGEKDEETVKSLRRRLREEDYDVEDGFEAAHAIAAATIESLEGSPLTVSDLFQRTVKLLDAMHATNPNFPTVNPFRHPVYVSHVHQIL